MTDKMFPVLHYTYYLPYFYTLHNSYLTLSVPIGIGTSFEITTPRHRDKNHAVNVLRIIYCVLYTHFTEHPLIKIFYTRIRKYVITV